MSSQSWFGNGATAAPQDGSRSREPVRSEDFKNGAFRAAALLREGSISVRLLCVMLFYRYLKFFLDMGIRMVRGPETHTSAGLPSLGRVSGNLHEAVIFAAIATPAGVRSRRRPSPLRPPPRLVPTKMPRSKTAMKTRAAVALEKGKPLTITEVELEGPKASEVLVEVKATGICHTDEFTLSGADPEGLFPAILGHERAGIVVDVGPDVTSVKKGDHVIPLYTPECRQCPSCLSRKTNLCTAIRATQGQGVMPDGTSRFEGCPYGS